MATALLGINLNDPRPASLRGWGRGWPTSRYADMADVVVDGVHFPAGVHEELAELVELLLLESVARGYIVLHPGWCWGYANRPIKQPDGGFTTTPSNHSWGIALDLNAPVNPFGGVSHQIPQEMADLWNRYGFRWGGNYSGTKDWMHFEFMGTLTQARAMTEIARRELMLTPEQEKDLEFAAGQRDRNRGEKRPRKPGPRREGWDFADKVLKAK